MIATLSDDPFAELLLRDRMHLLLDLWTALNFGILYLAFQAFPFIFVRNHGFSIQSVGLSFIGIGIGMTAGCITNILIVKYVFRALLAYLVPMLIPLTS